MKIQISENPHLEVLEQIILQEHIMVKMKNLESENNKNYYFTCLLKPEHVKTNVFGSRITKLNI